MAGPVLAVGVGAPGAPRGGCRRVVSLRPLGTGEEMGWVVLVAGCGHLGERSGGGRPVVVVSRFGSLRRSESGEGCVSRSDSGLAL